MGYFSDIATAQAEFDRLLAGRPTRTLSTITIMVQGRYTPPPWAQMDLGAHHEGKHRVWYRKFVLAKPGEIEVARNYLQQMKNWARCWPNAVWVRIAIGPKDHEFLPTDPAWPVELQRDLARIDPQPIPDPPKPKISRRRGRKLLQRIRARRCARKAARRKSYVNWLGVKKRAAPKNRPSNGAVKQQPSPRGSTVSHLPFRCKQKLRLRRCTETSGSKTSPVRIRLSSSSTLCWYTTFDSTGRVVKRVPLNREEARLLVA